MNSLFDTVLAELPPCELTDQLLRPATSKKALLQRIELAGMSKCFTYPVIDVEESINNVVSKSKIFNACELAGEIVG